MPRAGKSIFLLSVIDSTKTATGASLLEKMLIEPSINRAEIIRRYDIVGGFVLEMERVDALKKYLDQIADIPRILTPIGNHIRNPRELGSFRSTLLQLPKFEAKKVV
jgi:DNA mismatch repair ATPase MutS